MPLIEDNETTIIRGQGERINIAYKDKLYVSTKTIYIKVRKKLQPKVDFNWLIVAETDIFSSMTGRLFYKREKQLRVKTGWIDQWWKKCVP